MCSLYSKLKNKPSRQRAGARVNLLYEPVERAGAPVKERGRPAADRAAGHERAAGSETEQKARLRTGDFHCQVGPASTWLSTRYYIGCLLTFSSPTSTRPDH